MDSKTRSHLRSLSQTLSAIVMIGKEGHTDGVANALDEALDCHELVKVKFVCMKDQVRSISEALAKAVGCELVSVIGFTSVFFRQNPDPSKRTIQLH
ncbi:MAG: YhbY family RNA-binding protein [Sphaerochaetaceae bacterium]|jgi:RNA-binding protein|nr:YhbY family RNA-binding protein [Sphaerochaetaceae bacterium]NLY07213.1 YhbY family RNA-binding protein [Spirochaetales bacterium]